MAGLGWRKFNAGEVLTANNFQSYAVDQSVQRYAGTAARGSAIGTAVSEGMMSWLDDSNVVQAYDGSAWNSLAYASAVPAASTIGLRPVIPSSYSVGSGSGSIDSTTGLFTFTGASSISLNGAFSSTYQHYRIVFEVPTSTATTAFNTRFRTGGVDNSVAYYAQYWVMSRIGGTVQSNNGGSASSAGFGTTISLTNRFVSMTADILNPYGVKTTSFNGLGTFYDGTGSYMNTFSILYDNAVSFDGLTIFLSTGTMTGTLKIYGYN